MLHFKSINIGSWSFYEEQKSNRVKENSFKSCLSFVVNLAIGFDLVWKIIVIIKEILNTGARAKWLPI